MTASKLSGGIDDSGATLRFATKGRRMNKKDWMQTLLSLGLVLPGVAQAIGLGNLVVLSGPGEPFRAEIPIHGAHPNQLADLNAQLAGSAAYAMIHLPFAPATRNWQFSIRPGDAPAIVINSPTPLPPGATPFLVQLDWAGGQMVREYQAYPGTYNVPQRTALPMPAPLVSKTPAAAMPSPSSSTGWPKVGHYGPVPKGSSLFQIAQQLNGSAQVSQQQAMAALFKANPGAFIEGDPSRLIAGVMLKVPSIHEVRALSPLQAATLLHRKEQVAAPARAKAQPAVSTTAVTAPSTPVTPVGGTAKVATALSLTSAPALSAAKNAELTPAVTTTVSATSAVANPDQAVIAGLQKSLQGVEARLAVAQQQLATQSLEISKMSRNQGSSFPPLLWVSLGGNLLLLLLFIWMYRRQEQAASRQREISSKLTALGSAARSKQSVAAAPAPASVTSSVASPVAEAAPSAPTITPTKGPVPTPVSTPVPEALPATGAAEAESHASALEEPAPQAAEAPEMGGNRDGFDVDPIEQADLYQTYGKTEQAINVLQEALESNPRRRELYARLLTLYADADRRSDFLDLAERMRSRFGPNNSDWQEIAAKGQALFPGNALFEEEKNETTERSVPAASMSELREPEASLEPSHPADAEIEKLDFDFSSWGNQAETQNTEEEPAWTDAHQKILDEMNEQFRALDEDSRPALRLADDTENGMGAASAQETPLVAGGEEMSPGQEQVANAADWDAVGTKLDLAKAYVEMGDGEAARELLMEVQRDGNPAQQDEAMKLLANG